MKKESGNKLRQVEKSADQGPFFKSIEPPSGQNVEKMVFLF